MKMKNKKFRAVNYDYEISEFKKLKLRFEK